MAQPVSDDSPTLGELIQLPKRQLPPAGDGGRPVGADGRPVGDSRAIEPAAPAVDAELIDADEYQRVLARRRRDQVARLGAAGVEVAKRAGHATAKGTVKRTGAAWHQARRHGAIILKGTEDARRRRRADRDSSDIKAARALARDRGDLELVESLNRQVNESRNARVEAAVKRVDLVWTVAKRITSAVTLAAVVSLVLGIVNGLGGWMGDWNAADVVTLWTGGVSSVVGLVALVVALWWAALLILVVMWLFRRWKDGRRLGENVLPPELRKDDGGRPSQELTENMLVKALANIGNRYLTAAIKDGWPNRDTDHAWVRPPMPEPKGWGVQIRLPLGASVESIRKASTTLAHNLGCIPAELFIQASEADPTVLDLFRLDRGVLREKVPPFPLLIEGTTDYFVGFPVGITPRGMPVVVPMFQRNFVTAGEMGSGKSTAIIAKICAGLLDPLLDIEVWLFSDNQDYTVVEPALAGFYSCRDGVTPKDLTGMLRERFAELNTDLEARGALLRKHGVTSANRDVAAKEPGLRPKYVVIDECQSFFHQADPQIRREIIEMVDTFYMRARKFGVTVEWATPAPSDANLPRDMVSVTSSRACFAIKDKTRNNVVLGDKAHENGLSALGLKPSITQSDGAVQLNDVGTAITVNYLPNDGPVRFHYLSGDDQRTVVERALELRGGPVRREVEEQRDALADLTAVVREVQPRDGEDHPRAAALAEAMGSRWTRYQGWRIDDVRELLAEHGYRVPSTDRKYLVDPGKVAQALAGRDEDAEANALTDEYPAIGMS